MARRGAVRRRAAFERGEERGRCGHELPFVARARPGQLVAGVTDPISRGLANIPPTPWSFALLQEIINTSDSDEAVNLAERAVIRLKDIQKLQGNPEKEE